MDIYNPFLTREELGEYRRKLAKRANQRMVRLERATSKITGERYTFGAYEKTQRFLGTRKRFSESATYKTSNINALRAEIAEIERFLDSASSTVKGMRMIEEKRITIFESKGIHFSDTKEFYQFLNSADYDRLLSAGYTSEQIIEVYDHARQHLSNDEVLEKIREAVNTFQSVNGSNATLKNLYDKMGLSLTI